MLQAALAYGEAGRPVFPLRGKLPLTTHGFQDASAAPERIRDFWTEHPDANIGMPTGRASGVIVVDVDPRNGGRVPEDIPLTMQIRTGGGGWHYYFAADRPVACRVLAPGLDLKGDGGYVVVPPSLHPDTQQKYTVAERLPLAPFPENFLASFHVHSGNSSVAAVIPEGERNDTLFRFGCAMRGWGASQSMILAALLAANEERCEMPLDDEEVEKIAESAAGYIAGTIPIAVQIPQRRVRTTVAVNIKPQPVSWLWQDRIPQGALTLLGGREGVGKSILAYTLAAAVTRGDLDGSQYGFPRGVMIAASEDSWEHVIVPRLIAAEADTSRIVRVDVIENDVTGELSLPNDIEALRSELRRHDVALLILDPLMSRLGADIDSHRDMSVRKALEPLTKMMTETNVAALGLIHVNKSLGTDPLTILMGSRAFVAVARSVLFVMIDPEDSLERLLGHVKNNSGGVAETLTYTIRNQEWDGLSAGRLEWLGTSAKDVRSAMIGMDGA